MATINPKYSIGIEEMDAQHVRWIQLIDAFRFSGTNPLQGDAGISATRRALEKLQDYTKRHFASEEQFIAAHNFPDLEAHKAQHRRLEARVVELLHEISAPKAATAPLKLELFATDWLLEHIMQEDARYARFILGKPTS